MARPRQPLINRHDVIESALGMIDGEGLEALTIRRLGARLGVNGASLYHHFRDKESILQGVRMQVMREAMVVVPPAAGESWQQAVRRVTIAYRSALLLHPNAAPLMAPSTVLRPYSFLLRDQIVGVLLAEAVAADLAFAIIDSAEMLAYSSALLNPGGRPPLDRLPVTSADKVPSLQLSLEKAPVDADELFETQLDALLLGWAEMVRGDTARS